MVRQAGSLEKAAQQGYTLAQLNLIFAVKQAYYTYVQDQALVAVQQANVNNTKEELDLALAQVKAGTGEPSNLVTAETTYGAASTALSQAEQTSLIARINLALAIGVDPRTPIVTSNSQEPAPTNLDVDSLVSQAIKQRPDILQAIHTLRAAGYELSAARTTSAPSVNLDVIGQTTGTDEPFGSPGGALGLSITWEIYDGGVTAATIKGARADIETAQSQLQTATQTAISDVEQAYVNLKASEQQVVIDQADEKDAEEGVRLAEGQFKAGVAIFIQVVTAQTLLVQAQSALVQAQVGVQTARAQLRRAIGQM
jgi:outer membrane protein